MSLKIPFLIKSIWEVYLNWEKKTNFIAKLIYFLYKYLCLSYWLLCNVLTVVNLDPGAFFSFSPSRYKEKTKSPGFEVEQLFTRFKKKRRCFGVRIIMLNSFNTLLLCDIDEYGILNSPSMAQTWYMRVVVDNFRGFLHGLLTSFFQDLLAPL